MLMFKSKTMSLALGGLLLAAGMVAGGTQAQTLTAQEIMERVDTRYTGDSSVSRAQLILVDRNNRERVRDLRLLTLEEEGVTKGVTFFLSPTDVAGTAYLSYDYDASDDEAWLYLPALKQVRRVAAGDRSGSFMGSDFTYSDLNGTTLEWYDYRLLSDSEVVDGAPAWLIESTPKPEFRDRVLAETGYERSHLWIRQDNFVQVQGQIWVARGGRVKYFSARDLEEIDGIWTAKRIQMITTRNGNREHASVFQIHDVRYNEHNDPALFTTQAMQQGAN
ncbi:outer membrane lipoprotein-sorting protein [Salinispirillum marinum]|uniref:Outer membrane lipoprotein-sorting protein n=2 Tax=Saccharospirillaceae TaxID=255527 RepID=A0ABV8BJN0_9GAMM